MIFMNKGLETGCTLAAVKNSVLNTVFPVTFRLVVFVLITRQPCLQKSFSSLYSLS